MLNVRTALTGRSGAIPAVGPRPRPTALGPWATSGWALAVFVLGGTPMLLVALALTRDGSDAVRLAFHPEGVWQPLFHIGEELCMIGILAFAVQFHGFRIAAYLALMQPRGRYIVATLACAAMPAMLEYLIPAHAGGPAPDGFVAATGAAIALSAVTVGVTGPVWEELLFRGFLYRGLSQSKLDAIGAIVVTAAAWAFLHSWKGPVGMAETALVGVAWGWLRLYTGSTLAPIAAHVLNNASFALLAVVAQAGWIA